MQWTWWPEAGTIIVTGPYSGHILHMIQYLSDCILTDKHHSPWNMYTVCALFCCAQSTSSHYNDVIMGTMASQITSLTIIYSTVYSDADQSKYQSSASLAFVRGIHRWPVNSPRKWPITQKIFPFDGAIMCKFTGTFTHIFRVAKLAQAYDCPSVSGLSLEDTRVLVQYIANKPEKSTTDGW